MRKTAEVKCINSEKIFKKEKIQLILTITINVQYQVKEKL